MREKENILNKNKDEYSTDKEQLKSKRRTQTTKKLIKEKQLEHSSEENTERKEKPLPLTIISDDLLQTN